MYAQGGVTCMRRAVLPVSSCIKIKPSASAELNPSTWIMADVIRKRISAKNIPIIVDKIAENVFPLCPFNRRRVTAVDSMAHMILDAIGGHPENTAGRRNSMIRSIE